MTIEELFARLLTATDNFQKNGKVTGMLQGAEYTVGYTDQHRSSTTNHNLYSERELADFYTRIGHFRVSEVACANELPKHLFTKYKGTLRESIDDPLSLTDEDLKGYIAADVMNIIKQPE